MTPFRPKYIPFNEALRLVAERVSLAPQAQNPMYLALDEGALMPELVSEHGWTKLKQLEWQNIWLWHPNPYQQNIVEEGQTYPGNLRILLDELDELWPPDPLKQPATRTDFKNLGGAPTKYNWEAAMIELARICVLEDVEPSPPLLQRRLKEWFTRIDTDGGPSDEMIRQKVKAFHSAIWPPRT